MQKQHQILSNVAMEFEPVWFDKVAQLIYSLLIALLSLNTEDIFSSQYLKNEIQLSGLIVDHSSITSQFHKIACNTRKKIAKSRTKNNSNNLFDQD